MNQGGDQLHWSFPLFRENIVGWFLNLPPSPLTSQNVRSGREKGKSQKYGCWRQSVLRIWSRVFVKAIQNTIFEMTVHNDAMFEMNFILFE